MRQKLVLGVILALLTAGLLASKAWCFGCAAVPCFRNGPPCMGACTCQWQDPISGVCG